ncbi:MAG: ATP-dependent nuclease [Pseudomonadota bacterium]
MKRARVTDYWRDAYKNKGKTKLNLLRFESVSTIGSFEVKLGQGISAITGLNGAGKSTILHSLWLCLCHDASISAMALDSRLKSGRVVLFLEHDGVGVQLSYNFDEGKRECFCEDEEFDFSQIKATLLDVAEIAPALQRYVRKDINFQDLLDQEGSSSLSIDDLRIANYIAGRQYDNIRVYEMELDIGLDNQWGVFPYFSVQKGQVEYGVEHLGLGELSGLVIFWTIHRLASGNVLLIDEPESFLASHSQVAVSDLVAFAASERNVTTVLTSHSDVVVNRIPPERRIITYMDGDRMRHTNAASSPEHLSAIGLGRGTRLVAITEDRAATIFLRELITIGSPALRSSIEVCWAGSSGEVVSFLEGFIEGFSCLNVKFVGVLDGDQERKGHQCKWPLRYLPTLEDPEEVAKIGAYRYKNYFSDILAADEAAVSAALAKNEGLDFHDWPFGVGGELGRDHDKVLEAGLRAYIINVMSDREIEIFIRKLTDKYVLP